MATSTPGAARNGRPGRSRARRQDAHGADDGVTAAWVKEKIDMLAREKQALALSLAEIDRETAVLRRHLHMKDAGDDANAHNAIAPDEKHDHVYSFVGFKFKKAGIFTTTEIEAIVEKCQRKDLRGWIRRGALGVSGEVWGVGDRDVREAQWSAAKRFFKLQLSCSIEELGRRQESEVRVPDRFCQREHRKKAIVL